jgi:hypothetical protein
MTQKIVLSTKNNRVTPVAINHISTGSRLNIPKFNMYLAARITRKLINTHVHNKILDSQTNHFLSNLTQTK